MGGEVTDEGITLPSESIYSKLKVDYFVGDRSDRAYGAKHTEAAYRR